MSFQTPAQRANRFRLAKAKRAKKFRPHAFEHLTCSEVTHEARALRKAGFDDGIVPAEEGLEVGNLDNDLPGARARLRHRAVHLFSFKSNS